MKIYKIKVNGKSYKVELEAIEEIKSEAPVMEKKEEAKLPLLQQVKERKFFLLFKEPLLTLKLMLVIKSKKAKLFALLKR